MKTILVPVDFSPVTKRVMAEAAMLTRELGGRMILLNVTQPRALLRDHAAFEKTILDFDKLSAKANAAVKLDADEGGSENGSIHGDSLQLIGEPIDVILEQAAKLSADYIIVGSRGPALHDVVGSTAGGVIKKAKCPVIIVPARGRPIRADVKRAVGRRSERILSLAARVRPATGTTARRATRRLQRDGPAGG